MLILWLCLAGVLAVAEMLSLSLYLAPFAASALVAAALDLAGLDLWWQIIAFAVLGIALAIALRPLARRHQAKPVLTGPAALVGQEGVALGPIDQRDGRVKAQGGEWSARSSVPIAADADVRIVALDGAALVVEPKEKS